MLSALLRKLIDPEGIQPEDVAEDNPDMINLTAAGEDWDPSSQEFGDSTSDLDQIINEPGADYQPRTDASSALMEHLKGFPTQEKSGFWRKLGAGLTGAATALSEGPSRGIGVTEHILDDPYRKSIERWKMESVPLSHAASSEQRSNDMLARMADKEQQRKLLAVYDKLRFQQSLDAERGKNARAAADTEAEANQKDLDRQNRLDVANVRERGANARARGKTKLSPADVKNIRQDALRNIAIGQQGFFKNFWTTDDKGRQGVDFSKMSPQIYDKFIGLVNKEIDRLTQERMKQLQTQVQ